MPPIEPQDPNAELDVFDNENDRLAITPEGLGESLDNATTTPRAGGRPGPSEAEADAVRRWWAKTSDTDEFEVLVEQVQIDKQTLSGGAQEDIDDETAVTVQYAFNYIAQTQAMVLPDETSIRWKPKRRVSPPTNEEPTPEIQAAIELERRFCETVDITVEHLLREANIDSHTEAFAQDSLTFSAGILKLVTRDEYRTDPLTLDERPDLQKTQATLEKLQQEFDEGKFDESDSRFQQIQSLQEELARGMQVPVFVGFSVDNVPRRMWRIDPAIINPADYMNAGWMSHDVVMEKREAKVRFNLNDEDLSNAAVWEVRDGVATEVTREERDRRDYDDKSVGQDGDETDLVLVREIWARIEGKVYWIIKGLEDKFAGEWAPEVRTQNFYPFYLFVKERRPERLDGFSPTEMMRKLQDARNRKQTSEEDGHRAAQPRIVYDTQQVDGADAGRLGRAKPWEAVGFNLGGKNIRDAVMLLTTSHSVNPATYDDSKLDRAMAFTSRLPSQAVGVTNNADFSSEVQLAGIAANAMTNSLQTRFARVLRQLREDAATYALQLLSPEQVRIIAGPYAVWPEEITERERLYRNIECEVKVSMRGQFEKDKRAKNLLKLIEIGLTTGKITDMEPLIRAFARSIDEDPIIAESMSPQLSQIVSQFLAEIDQQGIGAIPADLLDAFLVKVAPLVLAKTADEGERAAENAASELQASQARVEASVPQNTETGGSAA